MKTLFPFIAVISTLISCSTSRSYESDYPNRSQQSFYYYPSANVYYDGGHRCYAYNNGRNWVTAAVLPSGFSIGNDRVQVYYNGSDVWRDNDRHRKAYCKPSYDDRRDDRRGRHGFILIKEKAEWDDHNKKNDKAPVQTIVELVESEKEEHRYKKEYVEVNAEDRMINIKEILASYIQ